MKMAAIRSWRIFLYLSALVFSVTAQTPPPKDAPWPPFEWPKSTRECRPWTYNWWLGSAVDTNNLAKELRRYGEAGLGGIHIVPIYGAQGAESRYLEYLSPEWMEMLRFCIEEGNRIDLGVDMTTGTGWCFGGPSVPKEQGGWRLQTKVVDATKALSEKYEPKSVLAMIAEIADGSRIDLRTRLQADGTVDWISNGQAATVTIVTAAPGGPVVKRAAPGGAGPMINPFSRTAMTNYLARFTEAFGRYSGPVPRSMYHDSFEYNSSWTPDLPAEFALRRGYRLEDRWLAFCANPQAEEHAARVRCDYQETLSDLLVERVFPEWIQWCRSRRIATRYQAHGSPGNLLDLYALADVPETEMFGRGTRDPLRSKFDGRFGEGDREPLIAKFASSAAHTAGRRLVSAETGTWMAEHFCETLEELKCLADLMFVSGVNHVFYHGTCYSPDDAAWPGWLFYASTEMNPRNAIWRDAPVLNAYIERCQSVLQTGSPDNDVLLYWPLHDFWQSSPALITPLSVHNHAWLTEQPVGAAARCLWRRGFGFDYVSDRLLAPAQVDARGHLKLPGGNYRVVVVPSARLMPPATLRKLLALAEDGAVLVFQNRLPEDVPGDAALDARREEFKSLMAPLRFQSKNAELREALLGKGRVLVGNLESALAAAGILRESICDNEGARFIRRRHANGPVYFIANQGVRSLDGWYRLATPARSILAMDPLDGRTGLVRMRSAGDFECEARLRLEPGQSVLLRVFERQAISGPDWQQPEFGVAENPIPGPWQVEFIDGGPVTPKIFKTTTLQSWTLNGDAETERFAGAALYRTAFDPPPGIGPWQLDLGDVRHSVRVRLNGVELGRLIMAPYRLTVSAFKTGKNMLELEVTNLSANRLRDLDRRQVPWRLFHDINIVNVSYRPLIAADWPLLESGLLGPVVIRKAVESP